MTTDEQGRSTPPADIGDLQQQLAHYQRINEDLTDRIVQLELARLALIEQHERIVNYTRLLEYRIYHPAVYHN